MELWEFNACIEGFNQKEEIQERRNMLHAWQIANFSGAAFGGKLKPAKHYLKYFEKKTAPKITKEEFEQKLALAEKLYEQEVVHGT